MEAFIQSVEADLRSLSTEARKSDTLAGQLAGWLVNNEHPEVKVAAERAILKLRALGRQPLSKDVLKNSKELLRPFLLACETKNARLTVLALGSVQKLLTNDAVSEEGVVAVITTLQHVERNGDEAVKLKMLQIVLALVQDTTCISTDYLSNVLGICFRILSHTRNTDTVLNTAAATIRQVVAVVFDHVQPDDKTEQDCTTEAALLLIDDLCHLSSGSPALWLQSPVVPQHFALELIEYIILHNTDLFLSDDDFETALREQICHTLQRLMGEAFELESEPNKSGPHKYAFKVLGILLSKFYASIPGKLAQIWHPLCAGASGQLHRWRQLLCLQVLKTCVSTPSQLYDLYVMYDMAKDFDILAVSRVVDVTAELLKPRKRSLGGEGDRVMPVLLEEKSQGTTPSEEMHDQAAVSSMALETLLKITNAIHQLSKECVEAASPSKGKVYLKHVCRSMLDRFASSFFVVFESYLASGYCNEVVVLTILKGYQDILQSAAAFDLSSTVEMFLESLCQFSLPPATDNGGENLSLTATNVHAVRTLLNVIHQLGNVLGISWTSIVTTLYALDGILQHSNADIRSSEPGTESDLHILETSLQHLFEGSGDLCTEAVVSLLSSLRDVSLQSLSGTPPRHRRPSFCLTHMVEVLLKNLKRVQDLWGIFLAHVIEVIGTNKSASWTVAIDALDKAVMGILDQHLKGGSYDEGAVENMLLVALESLFSDAGHRSIRIGILRIVLHVLQRNGEALTRGWDPIVRLLHSVPETPDDGVINAGFDSVELLVNEYLDLLPTDVQRKCLRVVAAFAKQTSVMNVSLSSINLLWSSVDMFGKEAKQTSPQKGSFPGRILRSGSLDASTFKMPNSLFYLINVLQELSLDKRPEVRNSGIRSFFSALVSYGSKFCLEEWNRCLADVLLPLLKSVYFISMTSSSDETAGVELGKEKGRSVMMLMHYSRNTERKQWEETMVLALNGLCKILRLYLPLLLGLTAFSQAWEQVSVICKNSMAQGTKDAALAAVALIVQVSDTFGQSTTQLPTQTITSILRSMDESIELIASKESATLGVVRYEIVKATGSIARSTKRVLPESTMLTFIKWLQKLAAKPFSVEEAAQNVPDMLPVTQKEMLIVLGAMPTDAADPLWHTVVLALCNFLYPCKVDFESPLCLPPPLPDDFEIDEASHSLLWLSHVVEQLEKIYLQSLSIALQIDLFSPLVASLARCMCSQFVREGEGSHLWIKAASLFRSVLDLGLAAMPEDARHGHRWMRDWETIAASFEAIYAGRHLRFSNPETISSASASELKLAVLDTLSEVILSASNKMSEATLRRLIGLIDGTISLHQDAKEGPGNLCHSCLRKLFVLCSQSNDAAVAIVALPLFVRRCSAMLGVFDEDEGQHLSLVRVGEVVFVLEMLSSLRVAPVVAEAVLADYPIVQRLSAAKTTGFGRSSSFVASMRRPHLIMIYETLCKCVKSKEAHVRSLVAELLKSVGQDIGLL